MVGSFFIFIILIILRFAVVGSLAGSSSLAAKFIPYMNWACIGGAALFVVFVVVNLLVTIFGGGRRTRR